MTTWTERAQKRLKSGSAATAKIAETNNRPVSTVSAIPQRDKPSEKTKPATSDQNPAEPSTIAKLIASNRVLQSRSGPAKKQCTLPRLAEESAKRFSFCEGHRRMLGGICQYLDAQDLDNCLLWQVVKAEPNLAKIDDQDIVPGLPLAMVLKMLQESQEPQDLFFKDRRWILVFGAIILGASDPLQFSGY
jgi:hypothetical protein